MCGLTLYSFAPVYLFIHHSLSSFLQWLSLRVLVVSRTDLVFASFYSFIHEYFLSFCLLTCFCLLKN